MFKTESNKYRMQLLIETVAPSKFTVPELYAYLKKDHQDVKRKSVYSAVTALEKKEVLIKNPDGSYRFSLER